MLGTPTPLSDGSFQEPDPLPGHGWRPNIELVFNGIAAGTLTSITFVFTDGATLNTGLNTIQTISSEVDGPGHNMAIDNLVLNGDIVVPEPSSALLLGPGLLGRRRA